jgi:lysophospholipase L1-like esterase
MMHPAVRRRRSAFAAGLATMAMALGLATAPAHAVAKINYYVALGDSYAAGQGGGAYLDELCDRSANAYSELADELKTVKFTTNVACGGATTEEVVNTQLGHLNRKTELVTITAGGNNLDFGALAALCGAALMNPPAAPACLNAIAAARAEAAGHQFQVQLVAMIESVEVAAPNSRIVVTGYPYLFDPIPLDPANPASFLISQANLLVSDLNTAIDAAALETGAQYVKVTDEFAGHGINSPTGQPWITFGSTDAEENFHPNAAGYEAYFAALSAAGAYTP